MKISIIGIESTFSKNNSYSNVLYFTTMSTSIACFSLSRSYNSRHSSLSHHPLFLIFCFCRWLLLVDLFCIVDIFIISHKFLFSSFFPRKFSYMIRFFYSLFMPQMHTMLYRSISFFCHRLEEETVIEKFTFFGL